MAEIYRRDKSPFWWISYTSPTARVRVSTGIRHEGRRSPAKDSPVWGLRSAVEEKQARAKFGLPVATESKMVGEFMRDHLLTLSRNVRPSSLKRYGFFVLALCNWLKEMPVEGVTYSVTHRYVEHRVKCGIKPVTLRAEVLFLKNAWEQARKLGLCEFKENPWTFTFKCDEHDVQPFTDAELAAIIAQPKPDWMRVAIDIALYTGARVSSIKGLRWEDVNHATIYFKASKTTQFTVPLHSKLLATLEPLRQASGTVMPKDVLAMSGSYFAQMFKVVCRHAGVPRGHFHLFRHTFISRLAQAGVEQRVTQLLANHASADVHRHYTHANAGALLPQLERLRYAVNDKTLPPEGAK